MRDSFLLHTNSNFIFEQAPNDIYHVSDETQQNCNFTPICSSHGSEG